MEKRLIRLMTIQDYDQMLNLWGQTTGIGLSDADSRENIEKYLKRNEGLSFVCTTENQIIGTILCGHDGRRGYIYHLAVKHDSRTQGVGNKLVLTSLEQLRQRGIPKCHLFLFDDNEIAIGFYEKTGWNRRHNLLIYSKDI
jgi:N-acetylglutamate synthase